MNVHAPLRVGKDIPPRARASIRRVGDHWTRYLQICDAITSDDAGPITIEDWSVFEAQYRQLVRLGVPFDEAFKRRVDEIALLNLGSDDDSDHDDADWNLSDQTETFCQPEVI